MSKTLYGARRADIAAVRLDDPGMTEVHVVTLEHVKGRRVWSSLIHREGERVWTDGFVLKSFETRAGGPFADLLAREYLN